MDALADKCRIACIGLWSFYWGLLSTLALRLTGPYLARRPGRGDVATEACLFFLSFLGLLFFVPRGIKAGPVRVGKKPHCTFRTGERLDASPFAKATCNGRREKDERNRKKKLRWNPNTGTLSHTPSRNHQRLKTSKHARTDPRTVLTAGA